MGAGRPSKFTDALKEKIIQLYEAGKTDAQVARIIGVSRRTIANWKGSSPEFLHTVKDSKAIADDLVEASLFSRATGYSHPEEKIFVYEGVPVRVPTVKHFAPDVTAAIFWLTNRQPDRWKRNTLGQLVPQEPRVPDAMPTKRTFAEFCVQADYFAPYPEQEEMRAFGIALDGPNLLLGSRGYGKTDYITIMGVAYEIYSDWFDWKYGLKTEMDETNLIITKSNPRNKSILTEIGNALIKNGVPLTKNNAEYIDAEGLVGKDHSVEAITLKTPLRGRHPKRTLMDDPVTEEDTSEAARALAKKKYDEAYKLTKNITIIGQPAHKYDLYSKLRGVIRTKEIPWGSIPQLDADLDAMRIAEVDPASIEMSYHLKVPKSGDSIFGDLKFTDQMPEGDTAAFIDPSEGGDFTSISIARAFLNGVAFEGYAWQRAWFNCVDDIVPILVALRVKRVAFETNKTGEYPVIKLRELFKELNLPITIVGIYSGTNKHADIQSAGSMSHMLHMSRKSMKVYQDQVTQYEFSSKFDDCPDSLARLLMWLGLIKGKK